MKKYFSFCRALLNLPKFLPVFADNLAVYKYARHARRGPLFLSWDLSHICNLRCIHCSSWKQNRKGLSFEQKIAIVRQLGESGIFYLGLGGGEPLLDNNIGDLIKEAKKWHMVVNVSTNGLLLEEKSRMLIASGVDFITVSVDSHKSEIHDYIRGQTGVSEKLKRGVEAIKKERKGLKPFVIIRTVVSRLNMDHLDEHSRYWEKVADDITFKPVNSNGICYSVPDDMRFTSEDREHLAFAMRSLLKGASFFEKFYYRKFMDVFFSPHVLKKERCFAGIVLADMDSQANLYFCGEERFFLGNLLEENFMKLWNSDRARFWRSRIGDEGRSCCCWSDCFLVNVVLDRLLGCCRIRKRVV